MWLMSWSHKVTQIKIGALFEGFKFTSFTICQLQKTSHFKTAFGTGMRQMLAGAAQAAGQLLSTVGAAGVPSIP